MNKNPSVDAGRAISSVMIERYIFLPVTILLIIGFVGAATSLWLALFESGWWALLTVVLALWVLITGALTLISYVIKSKLRPRNLNKSEKKLIRTFVSTFGIKYAVAKGIKKSPVALSGIIAWKYIKGRGKQNVSSILMEPINDFKDLKLQFNKIVELFN